MRLKTLPIRRETSPHLLQAAKLGARIATRSDRQQGFDDDSIRERQLSRFRSALNYEIQDEYERETLMAAIQRAIEDALTEEDPAPRI